MVVVCVREGFTGSIELHFKNGEPRMGRKVTEVHFSREERTEGARCGGRPLMRSG